ncbi:LLM class flavin-dependent oxidoreductase [Gordonia sp. zg691]|uniref:LLM class flavin-dependent oxidoreductase n=1 Tax=Gordonia jinghuaiqii TaxID=2758710 RepID=A0A7D7LYP3_9ACTN|nr:LLM class flavin-dependent oxidoreductase [Gordonia jinghuaiqii]MBD0863233.1 LLM class flavin-dependent oxidoreductase [Gordonia jinghuaiqii]MCR5980254.1 LLM class flavin-dependent oxidoreductase [Gordonia jinghuaiqii]QMT01994.1 LLM class flavin-dependent oxidoreductase [Gordonia jinghuaiqii]
MRHGICILPDQPWKSARPLWVRAEEMGFDHAWTYDHLVWGGLPDSQWFSCVPILSAAAEATSRIGLGTYVASPNFRHPVPFSREVQTLVDISDGRFLLGLGAGGAPDDAILGESELSARRKVDRLQEFTDLLARTLRDDHVDADGEYYTARDMRLVGGSVRDRVPLILAGNGPRTVRFAARHGDGWVTTGPRVDSLDEWFAGLAHLRDVLDDELTRHDGRTVDRYLNLDTAPRKPLESVAVFDDMVGRAAELGFTDVVVHWPRETEPYRSPPDVLEQIASRGLNSGSSP